MNKEEGGKVVDAAVYFWAGTVVSGLVDTAVACPLAGPAVVTSGWRRCGGESAVDSWATFPEKGQILSAEREKKETTFNVFKILCGCVCCVCCCCVVC
jgi:hypothetical protein